MRQKEMNKEIRNLTDSENNLINRVAEQVFPIGCYGCVWSYRCGRKERGWCKRSGRRVVACFYVRTILPIIQNTNMGDKVVVAMWKAFIPLVFTADIVEKESATVAELRAALSAMREQVSKEYKESKNDMSHS